MLAGGVHTCSPQVRLWREGSCWLACKLSLPGTQHMVEQGSKSTSSSAPRSYASSSPGAAHPYRHSPASQQHASSPAPWHGTALPGMAQPSLRGSAAIPELPWPRGIPAPIAPQRPDPPMPRQPHQRHVDDGRVESNTTVTWKVTSTGLHGHAALPTHHQRASA